jgi:hypothetical protein
MRVLKAARGLHAYGGAPRVGGIVGPHRERQGERAEETEEEDGRARVVMEGVEQGLPLPHLGCSPTQPFTSELCRLSVSELCLGAV